MKWRKPSTAPKDGTCFLANIGYPWPVIACWNITEQQWVYSTQQMNIYHGEDDPYFETEYADASDLKGWARLPRIKNDS